MSRFVLCLAASAALATTPALADTPNIPLRSDTDIAANSSAPVPGTGPGSRYSNWPALPERQAGKPYGQLVHTTFGVRERNFESGR